MSLLTQFYPGPGGGDVIIDASSSMAPGGFNGGNVWVVTPPYTTITNLGDLDTVGTNTGIFANTDGLAAANFAPSSFTWGSTSTWSTTNANPRGEYYLYNFVLNVSVSAPALNWRNCTGVNGGWFTFTLNSAITFSLPVATSWKKGYFVCGVYSAGTSRRGSVIFNAPNLVDVSTSTFVLSEDNGGLDFDSCVLNEASVDKVLLDGVACNVTFTDGGTGYVKLAGGCAPPSAAGAAAALVLQSRGFTVTTN